MSEPYTMGIDPEEEWARMTERERAVWAACLAVEAKAILGPSGSQNLPRDIEAAAFFAREVVRGMRMLPRKIPKPTCPVCGIHEDGREWDRAGDRPFLRRSPCGHPVADSDEAAPREGLRR